MKRLILFVMALMVMLVSLGGCFWGYDDYDRGGYGRGRGHDDRRGDHDRGGGHDRDDRGGEREERR